MEKDYEVEKILEKENHNNKIWYLIKWKNYSKKHNSW